MAEENLGQRQAWIKKPQRRQRKPEEKKKKRNRKLAKKEAKKTVRQMSLKKNPVATEGGSRFVTLMIIVIWIAILAVLIHFDVGGFGSTVMQPILKDVPYVNKILPKTRGRRDKNQRGQ